MEKNTDMHLSEEETRQKKRETAQWIMEIVRHLLIAAYDIDGDVKNSTINFWMNEGLGFTCGQSDDEAREHIAEAYYRLHCENRPGGIEDIMENMSHIYNIDAYHQEYDYSFIASYLPDEASHAIINKRKSKEIEERKDDCNMSFVGMIELDDGILAFGDSKGTRVFSDSTRVQEKGRIVQKVFRYGDELLVTHGLNEVSFGGGIIRMEDYINECMYQGIPLSQTLYKLTESTILEGIEKENEGKPDDERQRAEYHFMTGRLDNKYIDIRLLTVTRENVFTVLKKKNRREVFSLADVFKDDFESFVDYLEENGCTTIDTFCPRFQEWMEKETAKADEMLDYNSVGLPIQIEFLKF